MHRTVSSYLYFASRMALMSLVPAAAYWFASDLWVAFKVFLVFFLIGQLSSLWAYRKELIAVVRESRK
jgi:hypothetical protein